MIEEEQPGRPDAQFYCPVCTRAVDEPLMCGDCHALICRQCGTPLENADELAAG